MSSDTELVKLIEYTLRFHFGAASGQNNLDTIHGAFKAQYGLSVKAQYTDNQLEGNFLVVSVTILAVNMLNACISNASHDKDNQTTESVMARVKDASMLFNGAFQSMEASVSESTPHSTMYHLSK